MRETFYFTISIIYDCRLLDIAIEYIFQANVEYWLINYYTSLIETIIFCFSPSALFIFYFSRVIISLSTFSASFILNYTYKSYFNLSIIFPSNLLPSLNTFSPSPISTSTFGDRFGYVWTKTKVSSLNNYFQLLLIFE